MKATLIGFVAVLIWGVSLPVARLMQDKIGMLAMLSVVYFVSGCLGIVLQYCRPSLRLRPVHFHNPALYGRWISFILYFVMIMGAIAIVSQKNMPFVILANYFWPTAVILWSFLLTDLRIARRIFFVMGSLIILFSLSIEFLHGEQSAASLFNTPLDLLACGMSLAGAVCWGFYSALSRRSGNASGGSATIPLFQLTIALAFPLSLLNGFSHWENLTPHLLLFLFFYGGVIFIAMLCWQYGIQHGNIVVLSFAADFTPWISLLCYSVMYHVLIGTYAILAACLLVIGAVIARYGTLPRVPVIDKIIQP
jgi:drug/metabolite transporter (DMT)-like permease